MHHDNQRLSLVAITDELSAELEGIRFSPPAVYVYNPLVYAREPHMSYLTRFGGGGKDALFLGMNPGPWGMTQTGVPFGEVAVVREWLQIHGAVARPVQEHPKKRVDGFLCRRSEVSGRRLWGLFREKFPAPEEFFARFFVFNYCPLLFLDEGGRNITPEKLRGEDQRLLHAACDRALCSVVQLLQPRLVVGIGNFAATRAEAALAGMAVPVGKILHPSPANPKANSGWKEVVVGELARQGVKL